MCWELKKWSRACKERICWYLTWELLPLQQELWDLPHSEGRTEQRGRDPLQECHVQGGSVPLQ